jgi:mannosyltransferase
LLVINGKFASAFRELRARVTANFLAIAALLIYAVVVMSEFVNKRSIWLDESISVLISEQPYAQLLQTLKHVDAYHGFYYSLLHIWLVFGNNAFAVRSLSIVLAALSILVISFLARVIFGSVTSIPAAALVATSTYFLYYGDEARGTMLAFLCCALMAVAFWKSLDPQGGRWLFAFTLCAIAAIYANFVSLLFVTGLILSTLFRTRSRTTLLGLTFAIFVIVVCAVFPLALFIRSNLASLTAPKQSLFTAGPRLAFRVIGGPSSLGQSDLLLAGIAVFFLTTLIAFALYRARRSGFYVSETLSLLVWLLVPLVLGILIDRFVHPVLLPRYFSFLLIPTIVMAARGLVNVASAFGRRYAIVILVALAAVSIHNLSRITSEDWRSVVATLSQSRSGDVIVFWPPYLRLPFDYALREKNARVAATVIYPRQSLPQAFKASEELTSILRRVATKSRRVWLVQRLNAENSMKSKAPVKLGPNIDQLGITEVPELKVTELERRGK